MRLARLACLVLSGAALTVGGCSNSGDAAPAGAPAQAAPAVILGGVDLGRPLRAIGTEPFWNLEITPERLVYTAVDQPGLTTANPGPTLQGSTAVYAATGAGGATLVVTLMATECSDGMSDRIYPLTARVELGTSSLQGCAAPQSAPTS